MNTTPSQETLLPFRDKLGRRVREVWILWAKGQPNPKPSWLVPYDELSEPDKEADRCIGCALWADFVSENAEALANHILNTRAIPPTDLTQKGEVK